MTAEKTGFEIPEQMRDFTEKSMDQARKAFDQFMAATQKVTTSAEGSASAAQNGANEVSRKSIAYAEEHVDAAFRFASQLVQAKDINELTQLQQDYMRKQMESLGEQARDLGETATRTVQDIAETASR